MVSVESTAPRQKDLLEVIIIMSCPIQPYHKRSWIPAFYDLIFDRNFHYYLIIIQVGSGSIKKLRSSVTSREKKSFNISTNLILNRHKVNVRLVSCVFGLTMI
jgi:hypothetical protein